MGKARSFSDVDDDAVYQTESNNENYVMSSQQTPQSLGVTHFSDNSGYANISQAGRDQRNLSLDGGLLRGNIGFIIQDGFINSTTDTLDLLVDQNNDPISQVSTDRIPIISGVGNTTDLVTILGAQRPGQRLFLYGIDGNIITIKNTASAVDNTILTPGGVDFILTDTEVVELVYDDILVKWRIVGGTGNGGGLTEPVVLTVNEITPQTLPTTSVVDWSKNPNHITLDRDVEFSFDNLPASGKYEGVLVIIDVDATGGYASPVWPASLTNPPIVSTTALTRTSVMLYTIDGGTTVTHATSVGSSTGGGALLSNIVIDVNKDWLNFNISNLGELRMSGNIDVSTFDVLGIDRATFADDGSSITANNITQMLLNSSGSFQTNTATGNDFVWTINNGTIATFDADDILFNVQEDFFVNINSELIASIGVDPFNNGLLTIQSPDDAGGAVIEVFRDDVDGSIPFPLVIGSYGFQTGTTVASTVGEYASIQGVAEVVISGAIEGSLDLLAADGSGAQSIFLSINDGANNLVDIFKDLDMNTTNSILNMGGETINSITTDGTPDGATDFVMTYDASAAVLKKVLLNNLPFSGANVNLSNLSSTAVNAFINMGTNAITFDPSTVLIASPSSTILNIQFPTGAEQLRLVWNTSTTPTTDWTFTSTSLTGDNIILGNTLTINDSSTDPVGDGIFSRNGSNLGLQIPQFTLQNETLTGSDVAELSLLKIDTGSSAADNVAEINFSVFDNPTTTNYARIRSTIIDQNDAGSLNFAVRADGVNNITAITIQGSPSTSARTFVELNTSSRIGSNLAFQIPTGSASLKIFPALNQLGIVVQDNVSFSVGTLGSLAIPVSGTLPTTDSQADGFFGNHKGSLGMFDNGSGTLTLFYRDVDGRWASSIGWTRDVLTP